MPARRLPDYTLSRHARERLDQRGVSLSGLEAALRWGRRSWTHGDLQYRLDRRRVQAARREGIRVDEHEGTTVILTQSEVVKSVWRNRRPRRIRR